VHDEVRSAQHSKFNQSEQHPFLRVSIAAPSKKKRGAFLMEQVIEIEWNNKMLVYFSLF
tara:strand:- start:239 stop:415 length:177 start_codon:yes stop_codon:yes gene_type:complete